MARSGLAMKQPRRMMAASTPVHISNEFTEVARQRAFVYGWVNDRENCNFGVPGGILTDASLVYDLLPSSRVFITQFYYEIQSVSAQTTPWLEIELGFTSGAGGTGVFTPLTGKYQLQVMASWVNEMFAPDYKKFVPPIVVDYDTDGARSITVRVNTDAAGTEIMVEWHGWIEENR
jgi:hypothetical protein